MPSKIREEDIEVDEAPTSINPYAVLSLPEDATQDQIKTAYRKAALKHHPDKASPEDKDGAHTQFQEIAFAYAILSDERRRRRYDTTGRTEESLDLDDDDFDWATFFRQQYELAVTQEKVEKFASEYKGGEEERGHVLVFYEKHEGNVDKLYEEVMLSDVLEDDERFRRIIDAAIEAGEVAGYKKYVNESEKSRKSRITRAKKRKDSEAKEAEKAAGELEEGESTSGKAKGKKTAKKQDSGMSDLAALIEQRQKGREKFFDNLEAKYAPKDKKGTKRMVKDEPSEEAFARNAKKGKAGDADAIAGAGAGRSKRTKR